jgi:hypothetical protein
VKEGEVFNALLVYGRLKLNTAGLEDGVELVEGVERVFLEGKVAELGETLGRLKLWGVGGLGNEVNGLKYL